MMVKRRKPWKGVKVVRCMYCGVKRDQNAPADCAKWIGKTHHWINKLESPKK